MAFWIPLIIGLASTGLAAKNARDQRKAQNRAQNSANAIEEKRLRLAEEAEARAREQYERWQRVYAPIEDELIREASRYSNPDIQAGQAGSDVEAALATQRGALSRQMGRRGINPADGAVADAEARLALAGGKARAAAMTMARRNAVAEREQRLAQVAALGRNLPGMAYNFSAQAGAGLSDLNAQRQANLRYQNDLAGQSGSELGMALADMLRSVPEIYEGWQNRYRPITPVSITAQRRAA